MSILDELRQKAEEKKRAQHQQSLLNTRLEEVYQWVLLPKMQFLYDNLNELVNYLNFLEEPLPVRHYCTQYPQFGTLFQKNYKINTDGRIGMADYQRLMQINVSFSCEAEGSFSYSVTSKSLIEKEHDFLFDKGLRFQQKNQRIGDGALFIVERKIPVRFQILVNYASSTLQVTIFNHENFHSFRKSFMAEQLNDEFLDAFLCYFLRRDRRFVNADISPQEKAAILDHIAPFYEELKYAREKGNLTNQQVNVANYLAEPIKSIVAKFNKP